MAASLRSRGSVIAIVLVLTGLVSSACGSNESAGFDAGGGGDDASAGSEASSSSGSSGAASSSSSGGSSSGSSGASSTSSSSGSSSGGSGGSSGSDAGSSGGSTSGGGTSSGGVDGGGETGPVEAGPRNDFPTPILDQGAPPGAPGLFGGPDKGTDGPCLYEPEVGSLFPANWLPIRFRFTTTHNENLFQITLTVPNEQNPLVIYTTQSGYTMTQPDWTLLAGVTVGAPIHVTVRSAVVMGTQLTDGPWMGSEGDIQIAPVSATGTIVYWTTSGGTVLKGFKMGDTGVQSILTPAQEPGSGCVGCHTSTPDGLYVAFSTSTDPTNGSGNSSVDLRSVDGMVARPGFLTPSALALIGRLNQHTPSFSKAHWTTGDHKMLSMLNPGGAAAGPTGTTEIVWTDLEAASQTQNVGWGVVARTGDTKNAAAAQFSHDGMTVVYTSVTNADAAMNSADGLVYTVPYNAGSGGNATPLAGAADSHFVQYYPVFSADDKFIAFNRVPTGSTGMGGPASYDDTAAELLVVPSGGGSSTRLAANDPPACLGEKSPGVTNSWGKWSPQVARAGGKSYYFLVFSSGRDPNLLGYPQLYVAPIVVDGSGTISTYSALYFRNQPETEHNHTPAWDMLQIH